MNRAPDPQGAQVRRVQRGHAVPRRPLAHCRGQGGGGGAGPGQAVGGGQGWLVNGRDRVMTRDLSQELANSWPFL